MRKMILLASALALGGVAYAQDTSAPAQGAPTAAPDMQASPTPDQAAPAAAPDAGQAAPGGSMPGGTPDATAPQPGMTDGSAPARAATGPAGATSMTPTQGPTDLPKCSKSVTDNCKQAGGSSGGRSHKAMHHKKK